MQSDLEILVEAIQTLAAEAAAIQKKRGSAKFEPSRQRLVAAALGVVAAREENEVEEKTAAANTITVVGKSLVDIEDEIFRRLGEIHDYRATDIAHALNVSRGTVYRQFARLGVKVARPLTQEEETESPTVKAPPVSKLTETPANKASGKKGRKARRRN